MKQDPCVDTSTNTNDKPNGAKWTKDYRNMQRLEPLVDAVVPSANTDSVALASIHSVLTSATVPCASFTSISYNARSLASSSSFIRSCFTFSFSAASRTALLA